VSAVSKEETGQVQTGITELLRKRHRISGAKLDDFMIRDRTEIIEAANEAAGTLSYLLAGIASVALVAFLTIMTGMPKSASTLTPAAATKSPASMVAVPSF